MYFQNLKVSFIGGKGIINAHLRILKKLGVINFSLLSSSNKSTLENCTDLKKNLSIDIIPLNNKNELIEKFNPDCVFICSSHDSHFEYIEFFLNKRIPIFCEKPLFWEYDITREEVKKKLSVLNKFKKSSLFLNTSNRYFAQKIMEENILDVNQIKKFKFIFHTNGQFEFINIGVDLLPHGLSILHELFGIHEIKKIKKKIISNKFECFFEYKNVNIIFEFKQGKEISKKLSLHLDNYIFDRVQEGYGNNYKVYLENKSENMNYKLDDPFETHIKKFLENLDLDSEINDDFRLGYYNMLHMYDIIKG